MVATFFLKMNILFFLLALNYPQKLQAQKQQVIISIICKAIQQKKLLKFYYDDKYSDFTDFRVVEPHLIGDHKSTGNTTLVAWFLATNQQSANGHPEEWGNYLIERIQKIKILDKSFNITRPSYNPNDKRMKTIYCSVLKM